MCNGPAIAITPMFTCSTSRHDTALQVEMDKYKGLSHLLYVLEQIEDGVQRSCLAFTVIIEHEWIFISKHAFVP